MENFTKLAVFDFDGTLVDTPLPEDGKKEYKKKTGKDWPHAGWWGQPMSLDMNVFDMPTISSVISDYKKEIQDPNTMVVMVTGRMVKLTDLVKDILNRHGLKFHEYHFNRGGSTESAKKKTFDQILSQHPSIKEVTLFDDRAEHINIFKQWGDEQLESGRLDKFTIFQIVNGQPTLV
jgi:hypothetical protein